MQSVLFRLQSSDFVKGAITAVFAGVLVALAGVAQQPGFDVLSVDWGNILHTVLNVGVITFTAYIGKNFMTDSNGAVMGIQATKPQQ